MVQSWPWWRRFNVEIVGSFQLLPDRKTTWRQWLFSPGAHLVWLGKKVDPRKEWPEAYPRAECFDVDSYWLPGDEEKFNAGERVLKHTDWYARYFWASAYCRVLGFDLGVGVMWLANPTTKTPRETAPRRS